MTLVPGDPGWPSPDWRGFDAATGPIMSETGHSVRADGNRPRQSGLKEENGMDIETPRMGWITWEVQRRNRSLSQALGIPLFEIIEKRPRLLRYALCSFRTVSLILKHRFPIWICQSPSLVLATLSVICGRLLGLQVLVDAHNAAVEQAEQAGLLAAIGRWSLRHATRVIVSNERLADRVRRLRARPSVLSDPLPLLGSELDPNHDAERESATVFAICTWADDEPFDELLRAAELLPEQVVIHVTGDSKGRERNVLNRLPSNVRLLGFIDEHEYVERLVNCDVAIDLTTREDCLVCGGYEAVSAGRPLILSDTMALREHFRFGTLFTCNDARSIGTAIMQALTDNSRLTDDMEYGRSVMRDEWNGHCAALLADLDDGNRAGKRAA